MGPTFVLDELLGTKTITNSSSAVTGFADPDKGGFQINGFFHDQEEDGTPVTLSVVLQGAFRNQPPVAVAGPSRTLECNTAGGAQVTLDGSASTDPDNNIVEYIWFVGRDVIGEGELVPLGVTSVELLAYDLEAARSTDATTAP
jgi:hypothetical protein